MLRGNLRQRISCCICEAARSWRTVALSSEGSGATPIAGNRHEMTCAAERRRRQSVKGAMAHCCYRAFVLRRVVLAWLIVAAVTGAPAFAVGAEETARIGSMTLEIARLGEFRHQARIGDVVVADDFDVHVERVFSAGPEGTAVLAVANGGNECAALYEIVFVAADGDIAKSDEFGDCFSVSSISGNARELHLQFDPVAGLDGWRYRWTADGGLEEPSRIAFAPKAGTGWAHARDLIGRYPSLILDNEEISRALMLLLGEEFDAFKYDILAASEMEEVAPDLIVGHGCLPQECTYAEALVALDIRHRRVYAAIYAEDGRLRVYPPEAEWPRLLRNSLHLWRAEFM